MNNDQRPSAESGAAPYTPSDAARQAFSNALAKMAMYPYRELPENMKPRYALGFAMGFDGLPFPREAIDCRAMDDGFMFGARAIHKGYQQHESEPIVYA